MNEIFSQLTFGWRSAMMGTVLLPIIISALLLLRAGDRSMRWLVALMACTVLSSVPFFIGFAGAYDVWPDLTFLPVDMNLTFAPLLYLYVHSALSGQRLSWRAWLLLPAALYFVYQLGAFTLLGGYQNKWAFTRSVHDPYVEPVVGSLTILLTIGCLYATHRLYQAYKRWLPTTRADEDQFQPIWLNYFMVLGGVLGVLWVGLTVMELRESYNYRGRYWLVILTLMTFLMILLETLSRSRQTFPKMPDASEHRPSDQGSLKNRSPSTASGSAGAKDLANTLMAAPTEAEERDWSKLGEALRQRMIKQQWFLEPDFSLAVMCRRAGVNRSYASRALNEGLGQNFSQFVNRERAEHAARLLVSGEQPLLDIAYDSGFGSKASFNRVFRQALGCTPTQYRRQNGSKRKNP